jgi:hypothetical protein
VEGAIFFEASGVIILKRQAGIAPAVGTLGTGKASDGIVDDGGAGQWYGRQRGDDQTDEEK